MQEEEQEDEAALDAVQPDIPWAAQAEGDAGILLPVAVTVAVVALALGLGTLVRMAVAGKQ